MISIIFKGINLLVSAYCGRKYMMCFWNLWDRISEGRRKGQHLGKCLVISWSMALGLEGLNPRTGVKENKGIEDLIKMEILRQWGFPRLSRLAPDVIICVHKRQKGIWYWQPRIYCEHGSRDWRKMIRDQDVRVCQKHLHELICGNIIILKF